MEYIKKIIEKGLKDNDSYSRFNFTLSEFKDNIDDYDNVSYYWIEDEKQYEVLLSYNLDDKYRLYFGFFIGERDLKTRELEIFISSGI